MRYVLFVCYHNAGRSQMAQAFFERHAPEGFRAESAGTNPAKQVYAVVAEAMREVGLDISGRRPRRLPEMLNDRTAHQLRLVRLLPQLAEEIKEVRSPEEIRACADVILDEYDGALVRSFVLQLAHRRTRDCLRAEVCEPLALV